MKLLIGIFLLLLLVPTQRGATITVCASGCAQTTLVGAWNAASPGDTIVLKSGETFASYNFLPWKSWSAVPIIITSSKWAELPVNSRVNETDHGALMAKITPANGSDPLFKVGGGQNFDYLTVSSVDTGANTITLDSPPGSNGDPIAFYPTSSVATMPGGVVANKVYYVSGLSSSTFSILEFLGGPAVDITSNFTGTIRSTPVKVATNFIVDGIWFSSGATANAGYFVYLGTGAESAVVGVPRKIRLNRILLTGTGTDAGVTQNGPNGIIANCRGCSISNSSITKVKVESAETKGILVPSGSADVQVINTEISAAALGFLVGGSYGTIQGIAPRLRMDRVYNWKSGFMLYNEGAGAPSGACFTGRFYRNTSIVSTSCADGQCYTCSAGGAWEQNLTATYRADDYLTKSMGELKQCNGCEFTRMVTKNGFAAGDVGNPGYCLLASQVDGVGTLIKNTKHINSLCDNTWRGIAIATDCSGGCTATPNNNILFKNILMTNQANFPAMSIWAAKSDVQAYPYRLDAGTTASVMDHNTARYAAGSTTGNFWILLGNITAGVMNGTYFKNNLGQQYGGLFADGSDGTCGASGLGAWVSSATQIENNLQDGSTTPPAYGACTTNMSNVNPIPYISSSDSRLTSGSPYSANCSVDCAFDGTDGKDLGADVDLVEADTCGVVSGTAECIPNFKIVMGSTRGIVSYSRPTAAACSLTLYTDAARLTEDADTNTAGNKLDTRTDNVVDGTSVQFVLGTVDALSVSTTYYYKLACGGGNNRFGSLKTYAAASGDMLAGFSVGGASITSRYSSAAAMSSPTTLTANVNPRFAVPQGTVRYWQMTDAVQNGPIKVVVAR